MSTTPTSKILRMNPRIFMVWIFMTIGAAAFCYWMIQLKKFDDNNEEDMTITAHDFL